MSEHQTKKPDSPERVIEKQRQRAEQDARNSTEQPSQDPQLRRVHERARTPDESGRANDTSMDDGGARHRQQ